MHKYCAFDMGMGDSPDILSTSFSIDFLEKYLEFCSKKIRARATMDFHSVRTEVCRLGKKNLFKMLMNQKESGCLLKGLCPFRFNYKGYPFCISEVLGQGCESERLKKVEQETGEAREEPILEKKNGAPLFD